MSCNVFRFVLSIVVVLMGVGCKKNANVDVTYRPGIIQMTSKDFLIPRELKSQIDSEYIRFIRRNNPKVIREDHELLEDLPRDFLNVQIAFRASADGVLSDHTEFSLPRGGGMIDLKQYVKGTK
ncbi:MAG: hypothetical protein KDD38_07690, partial [Bdellovibrionales bacterium]|nr:hypothetical protein [Bdellovibrionales bacterium]